MDISREELAKMIDHSLLKPNLSQADTIAGIETALRYDVAAVTVMPYLVPLTADMVRDSDVLVDTVVGFPHGNETAATKAFQAHESVQLGAQEVDMVINISALISGEYDLVGEDIAAVVEASKGATVKVILETAYLTDEQKVQACKLADEAGADFVKTSTGFAPTGFTVEDLELMRRSVREHVQIKAAQGVRSYADALVVRAAGATRFGCTRTAKIIAEWEAAHPEG